MGDSLNARHRPLGWLRCIKWDVSASIPSHNPSYLPNANPSATIHLLPTFSMEGPRDRGCGHSHRGSGRGGRAGSAQPARSSSSARSPSPAESECKHNGYFEFVVHITEDPLYRNKILDKFAEFLTGWELAVMNLQEVNCGFCW
jgi:hypothetical protein